jgi:hypothetical protein
VDDIKGVEEVLPVPKSSGGVLSSVSRKSSRKERAVKTEAKDDIQSGASEDSKGSGKYEIVDMNMPSYSGSTIVKDKSIFSL